jgi:hypothetical protein
MVSEALEDLADTKCDLGVWTPMVRPERPDDPVDVPMSDCRVYLVFDAGGLGLPSGRLTGPCGPDPIGIPRSTRVSCDRVGCPRYPGNSGALTGV